MATVYDFNLKDKKKSLYRRRLGFIFNIISHELYLRTGSLSRLNKANSD